MHFSSTAIPFVEYPDWWTDQKRSTKNYTYFYIRTEDNSEYSSTLLAYEELLSQLETIFGNPDISEMHRAELITNQAIEEYSLTVNNLQIFSHSSISYECIMEARVPTEALYEEGSESFITMTEDLQRLIGFKEQARNAYRGNEDVKALEYYIQAALIAENYPSFSRDNSFDELAERIIRIVENAYVNIYDANSKSATCFMELKRRSGIIHPNVIFADIEVIVPRQDNTKSTLNYKTDADGTISFFPKVRDISVQGTISFNIKLPQSLNLFRTKHGRELVDKIKEIHAENTSYFVYELQSKYNEEGINLVGLFYDNRHYEIDSRPYLELVKNLSQENMISMTLNETFYNEEEYSVLTASDIFEDVKEDVNITEKYILTVVGNVLDVMVVDQEGLKGVRVMLDVLLQDRVTGDVYYRSDYLDGVGFDNDETVAMEKAYTNAIKYLERQLQVAFYDYHNKGKR